MSFNSPSGSGSPRAAMPIGQPITGTAQPGQQWMPPTANGQPSGPPTGGIQTNPYGSGQSVPNDATKQFSFQGDGSMPSEAQIIAQMQRQAGQQMQSPWTTPANSQFQNWRTLQNQQQFLPWSPTNQSGQLLPQQFQQYQQNPQFQEWIKQLTGGQQ